jgi:hypothetical protein
MILYLPRSASWSWGSWSLVVLGTGALGFLDTWTLSWALGYWAFQQWARGLLVFCFTFLSVGLYLYLFSLLHQHYIRNWGCVSMYFFVVSSPNFRRESDYSKRSLVRTYSIMGFVCESTRSSCVPCHHNYTCSPCRQIIIRHDYYYHSHCVTSKK